MQISVSTRHGHLSEASQEKLKNKAEKLTRIFDRITSIELVIDLKDETHPTVTLEVSAEHKHDFVAHETATRADSLMGAVESAISKIEQQLRKYKTKVQERHRNPDARRRKCRSVRMRKNETFVSPQSLLREGMPSSVLPRG